MNRKVLSTFLPLAGLALVIGTGFAAWSFTESETNDTLNGSGTLESAVSEFGTVSFNQANFTFKLDQGTASLTDGITTSEVSFTFNENANYALAYPTATYTYTASLSSEKCPALLTYVELNSTTGSIEDKGTIQLSLQYIEGKKPTTIEEYNTMKSALGSTIELTITATVSPAA